jgi:hypothetical protein
MSQGQFQCDIHEGADLKDKSKYEVNPFINNKVIASYRKQEGHDGPGIAHLYIGPWAKANFKPGAFI